VTFTSNIQGVLDRARARPRQIAEALRVTLAPAGWVDVMRQEAAKTLWAIAKPEEWQQVKLFTVVTDALADGFFSAINNPIPPVMALQDFAIVNHMQLTQVNDGQGGPNLFSNLLNQFDELMTDWVANEKRKDRRDWDKSDEEIGRWIGYLLLTPGGKLSPDEKAAKAGFMRHIPQWLEQQQKSKRISDATVNAWLLAVLAAWRELVRREFPARLERQYRQLQEVLV
jgi:hypothetical protein